METDLLAGACWECTGTLPGSASGPEALGDLALTWHPASVPGTVAGSLLRAGQWTWGTDDEAVLDGQDWWFRCVLPTPVELPQQEASELTPWRLELDGLATIADVWLAGEHVLRSENMFLTHDITVRPPQPGDVLHIRFAALSPLLAGRHHRPRWKSRLVRAQSLRWYRTTLLGRMPGWSRWGAPVGPWRPVRLTPTGSGPVLLTLDLDVRCTALGGAVSIRAVIGGDTLPATVLLVVGGYRQELSLVSSKGISSAAQGAAAVVASGTVDLDAVERWWPHTHGSQPRYPARLEADGAVLPLGEVAFREVAVDRADGGFALALNGVPVFARGVCWGGPDMLSFNPSSSALRGSLTAVRDAGMNMVRIGGYSTYETQEFWDLCDELGILVWQDCMIASVDPPEESAFIAGLEQELHQVLRGLQRHPALTVVCGSSESYQQAAMYGLPPERWLSPLLERTIPALVEDLLPGIPYVPSSPSGGDLPFATDSGVAHYFGVGAYLRPASDARLAGVRFAAECLSFGTPPEPETVQEAFAGAAVVGHDPRWKATVARDAGTSWDFEDVRDHYVRELFRVDPLAVRYADPERALDLGRAAVVHLMTSVLGDWRCRPGSPAGALVLTLQDLWPGAGWGLIDALGRPKAPWYPVARVLAPQAVLLTDEGLSGLRVHVVNDRPDSLRGTLKVTVFTALGAVSEQAEQVVEVAGRALLRLGVEALLGGFRDLTRAYRFSPATHDVVLAELLTVDGVALAPAVHLPDGPARPRLPNLGLRAEARPVGDGWALTISTALFAQHVALDVPGFRASDSWFHLAPGAQRSVLLTGSPGRRPRGSARALNTLTPVAVTVVEADARDGSEAGV